MLLTKVSQYALCLSVIAYGVTAQSFEPHLHPKSKREHRKLAEGFHSDIDDIIISAGFQHSCGIQASGEEFGGTITCWGFNQKGQAAPPQGTFIQVSCGNFHSCGLTIDEEVMSAPPQALSDPWRIVFTGQCWRIPHMCCKKDW